MNVFGRRPDARRLVGLLAVGLLVVSACSSGGGSKPEGAAPSTTRATRPNHCPEPTLPPGTELGAARLRWTADCLPFVRTPDERFDALSGFPYEPRYAKIDGLRLAYYEAGPADGEVVLLLHGEPSWSYLYRKMIPILAGAGYRVLALDMMGMGRSDKPVELGAYSYLRHVHWVESFVEELDLEDVTAFVQDWGSLIGLRVIGDNPDRFARVVVANGRLPVVPEGLKLVTLPDPPIPTDLPQPFDACAEKTDPARPALPVVEKCFPEWAIFALTSTQLRAGTVIERLTTTTLSPEELAAYDAPFPSRIYMTGPRVFPSLINTLGEAPTNAAARAVFDEWTKPLLTLFGRQDMTLGTEAVQAEMRDTVPGAQAQPHHAYPDANHFIQEDQGRDLAERVVAFMRAS